MITPLINSILAEAPQSGKVERIALRPGKGKPLIEVQAWDLASVAKGEKDYGRSKKRAVTLIQAEHLPIIASLLGRDDWDYLQLRRNVLVSGINLRALIGWRFKIGTAILRGTDECDPCEQMEATLGPGTLHAMIGHGGLCAAIETPGRFQVGDPITRLERVS
jgi:MOSC domain-containing protein YiiM